MKDLKKIGTIGMIGHSKTLFDPTTKNYIEKSVMPEIDNTLPKFILVGPEGSGMSVAHEMLIHAGYDPIIIDSIRDIPMGYNNLREDSLVIDGKIYNLVNNSNDNRFKKIPELSEIIIDNNYKRELPRSIDIVKEFKLIKLKQSNLSKWERDEVVRLFNLKYYEVK